MAVHCQQQHWWKAIVFLVGGTKKLLVVNYHIVSGGSTEKKETEKGYANVVHLHFSVTSESPKRLKVAYLKAKELNWHWSCHLWNRVCSLTTGKKIPWYKKETTPSEKYNATPKLWNLTFIMPRIQSQTIWLMRNQEHGLNSQEKRKSIKSGLEISHTN